METLRPLSLGELLDRTFQIYRNNFLLFAGIAAVAYLPMFIIRSGLVLAPQLLGSSASVAVVVGGLFLVVLYLVGVAAAQSGTIIAVSSIHLSQPITISEAYRHVSEMLGRIILLTIGVGMGIGLGFLFLIVPGVVLLLMWALAIPVAVLEDASLGEATSRSRALTAGHRGRVFMIYLVFSMLSGMVGGALAAPLAVVAILDRNAAHETLAIVQILMVLASYLSQILVTPLMTIAFSLMYYDERVRKEAFDIELMMKGLEGNQGQSATATAS
jgi:Membrane domain of glycerophosphoryl diester phosphodiesterase